MELVQSMQVCIISVNSGIRTINPNKLPYKISYFSKSFLLLLACYYKNKWTVVRIQLVTWSCYYYNLYMQLACYKAYS